MTKRLLVLCLALLGATVVRPALPTHASSTSDAASALPAQCRTTQLRGSIGGQNGGAGNVYTTLILRDISRQTCTLRGYPGISLVDPQLHQIGQPAHWDARVARLIVLHPGDAASTTIRSLNPGVGTTNCLPPSTALRIYPPNQRTSLLVPAHLSECLGALNVLPLVSGTNGL